MKRILSIVCMILLLTSQIVFAVGSVTQTDTLMIAGRLIKISLAWTADGSGDVSGATLSFPSGYIMQAILMPGSTTPSDLYDITFTLDGVDILDTEGMNQSDTTGEVILFSPPLLYDGAATLALVVANAGATNTGTIEFYVRAP